MKYNNAQSAFEDLYRLISSIGEEEKHSKALYNIGFEILNPLDNLIETPWRKWSKDYADFEWEWYLSGDRSGKEIAKRAKIWEKCMDKDGNVNSNYGWHWQQNDQISYVVDELNKNPESRRASISIYDAKNRHNFENDTPCTYAINFSIREGRLQMCVMMRSNDLWYGFCNDQYFFSKLQKLVAGMLALPVGSYYHFVNNLHIYNNFLNKNK